jgi:uncharacterized protein YbaR (Trm112 family)/SAM-dependent methyltransferase
MDLYDIIACPVCKEGFRREEDKLTCQACGRVYPIVNGVPVLLPDGSIPNTEYQHELLVRDDYSYWIPLLVMQSLPASAIILNVGAGNQALDLSNVIRMDVTLTPYVDVVGDAHALPFKPGTFDLIFSLAVIEHLRNPFLAAQETFDALRNGGYVYGDCNFVFAYHGYPHHYFNASEQGLEEAFGCFEKLRTGVAPYQMPAFALSMVLKTYLNKMGHSDDQRVLSYRKLLERVLEQPLMHYDALFTEEAALYVAAGVYFFGRKAAEGESNVIPQVLQNAWKDSPELQERFPNVFNLGTFHNILMWAKQEGRHKHREIEEYFQQVVPFRKGASVNEEDQKRFEAFPFFEPQFYAMPDDRVTDLTDTPVEIELLTQKINMQNKQLRELTEVINTKDRHIKRLESLIKRLESGRVMKLLGVLNGKKNPSSRKPSQ